MQHKFSSLTQNQLSQGYLHNDVNVINEADSELKQFIQDIDKAHADLFSAFAKVVEYSDGIKSEHPKRVGLLSAKIAFYLDMPSDFVTNIYKAAQLHDVGNIAIPRSILFKVGRLTKHEYEMTKGHCEIGAELLSGSEYPVLKMAEQIALAHHEKLDGSGYPFNLVGAEIPLSAKIVAVADIFDVLSHKRPFQKAWKEDEILSLLVSKKDIHFSADVVDALLNVLKFKE